MTDEPRRSSDAVEALLAASAGVTRGPSTSAATPRQARAWTLGYVDATGLQRSADLGEHTARIREYAERHQLTLISTHVDLPYENGLGFRALLASIERTAPQRVLVSRLAHLDSPVIIDGEPTGETKLERLKRLAVDVQEVFP
ncbi:hypothetical protein OG394_29075 [Kribbella sp. NBC_01245]|uniref:hypothetical protein n=1 Tax=Kribbella sp. NBC_01245 TaxID=2903578 RepID=UPI002E2AF004|nr:hypothetical protein [Kribbella sp. NBC_01245]